MKKLTYERLYQRSRHYRRRNFFFTLVLIAAIVFFAIFADSILREFEGTQPKYLVDGVAETLEKGDYTGLYAGEDPSLFPEETINDYYTFVTSRLAGQEITWREAVVPDQTQRGYKLYAGGQEFAYLTLRRSAESTRHGFEQWEVEGLTTSLVAPVTYTVRAQETSTVCVDGKVLGAESLTQSNIATDWDEHLLEGMAPQKECAYQFTRCFSDPVVTATDYLGRVQTVSRDGNAFTTQRCWDDESFQEEFPRVEEVLHAVADYVVGIRTVHQARAYCVKDSPASETMYMYSLWTSTTASRARIEDFSCSEFIRLSDDFFCCHVTANFICTFRSRDDTTYELNYEMYFKKEKERWALYDIATM